MSARHVLIAGCALVLLTGCAGSAPPASATSLQLPTAPSAASLASATLYTSPDGGIYQNPDTLQVLMIARLNGATLPSLLPGLAQAVKALQQLGPFTFVGVRVTNNGKAGSDPQFNSVQIASDYAPAGTASGPLRTYYHPLFPLAMLAGHGSDATCTVHLDPGQGAVVVMVYPPITASRSIVWGVYKGFALRVAVGGALPSDATAWQPTVCVPPRAPAP
jgi:hypothetical protein